MPNLLTEVAKQASFNVIGRVLSRLSVVDPNVICAGGAPRDLFFGLAPKDYDFFLSVLPYYDLESLKTTLSVMFSVPREQIVRLGVDYEVARNNGDFFEVFQFHYEGRVIEVIVLHDVHAHSVLDGFPCQLSMGYINLLSLNHEDPIMNSIILNQVQRKGYCSFNEDAPEGYLQRMRRKFPYIEFISRREWLHREGVRTAVPEPDGGFEAFPGETPEPVWGFNDAQR